jgi:tetratricopeptide (TPR) repeat protein
LPGRRSRAEPVTKVEEMADAGLAASRRRLMVHDGVAFLLLTLGTGVLFAVTLLLFNSFKTHREDLAVRWAQRGQAALNEKPQEAVVALRTALRYAPDDRGDQLMLAEALENSGHTDEATSYFLNLWETQPGDGKINVQLARLARKKGDREDAVRYYRAAVFGSWEGDGVVRRRDARLELANYLIDQREFGMAQNELLIAGGNAPADPGLELGFGDALLRAGDANDALKYYQKAMAQAPRSAVVYEKAGRLAYSMGHYARALTWLERAARESAGAPGTAVEKDDMLTLLKNSERLLVLDPVRGTTQKDRIGRVLNDLAVAKRRFSGCMAAVSADGSAPASMQALSARWAVAQGISTRTTMLEEPENEGILMGLVGDTEVLTAQLCGEPAGDDALLLLLAHAPKDAEQ